MRSTDASNATDVDQRQQMIETARQADDSLRTADFRSTQPGRGGAPEEPVCFVVDPKPGIRGLVVNVCSELGLRVDQFDRLSAMIETGKRRKPDLIFLEPAIDGCDGEQAIQDLIAAEFRCPEQGVESTRNSCPSLDGVNE